MRELVDQQGDPSVLLQALNDEPSYLLHPYPSCSSPLKTRRGKLW